jgi:NADPH-dependent ferric siderophore reductase
MRTPFFPPRPHARVWPLTAVAAFDLTPRMRRVRLIGETLTSFSHSPGQHLVLSIPGDGRAVRRRYTVRAFDRAEFALDVDVVLHGASPGSSWARRPFGKPLVATGPRGRTIVDPTAQWHLFSGDESALPAIFTMAEALPPTAKAVILLEVDSAAEEQPLRAEADVDLVWLRRLGPAGQASEALIRATGAFSPPAGLRGHVYLLGETQTVRAQARDLIGRGFDQADVSAEGYWREGREGGHEHVFDRGDLARAFGRRSFRFAGA